MFRNRDTCRWCFVPAVLAVALAFPDSGKGAEAGLDRSAKDAEASTKPAPDDLHVRRWLEFCLAWAKDYRIAPTDKPEEKFKLLPDPVFRHGQATRGAVDIGSVYLWTMPDGRPGAIGTIFVFPNRATGDHVMVNEFHSLADAPLTAVHRGLAMWTPNRPGLTWKPLPNAPAPSATEAGRTRQMRDLARRFQGHSIDHDGGRWELRLVPQPLYRYELKKDSSALGGAVFALCQGTDPEIILCLEARRAGENSLWHYALGSFSDFALHARFDDVEVWNAPRAMNPPKTEPHWIAGIPGMKLPEETKAQETK